MEETALTTATLFSCQRNEGPFLIEWVAYHRLIGFKRIVIYSNDCTDGSDKILDRLQELGLVQHMRHSPPPGSHIQTEAMDTALKTGLLHAGEWLLWLDVDEFLNIHVGGGHLGDLMPRLSAVQGIRFNWRCFGDDGGTPWNGFQIDPAYCRGHRRYSKINRHVKTLYRFDPDNMYPYAHGPVLSEAYVAAKPAWLNGSGRA
ncbi:MAG: glycosyltransferase family 2 protein, partial [Pseudomonadota bacterium]